MDYVFVFVGEFGYELLNWQGRVRRFARSSGPDDRVFCAGRRGVGLLYEAAAAYVTLSDFLPYASSLASGYFCVPPNINVCSRETVQFLEGLKAPLERYIRDQLAEQGMTLAEQARFVHSFESASIGPYRFGLDLRNYGPLLEQDIYSLLPFYENDYVRLTPKAEMVAEMCTRARVAVGEPFILCQSRYRNEAGEPRIDVERLLSRMAAECRVVFLTFASDRTTDSFSTLEAGENISVLHVETLAEQCAIIAAATECVFFTEGDFGSHIYIPPLLGKTVTAVCYDHILNKGSTPLGLWNQAVFNFGGQILLNPLVSDDGCRRDTEQVADSLVARIRQRCFVDKVAAAFSPDLFSDMYLWPNTPIDASIQQRIEARVGSSDIDPNVIGSRPEVIGQQIGRNIAGGGFDPCLTILDIACGDGLILKHLKERYPLTECVGIDCNAGQFDSHAEVIRCGVRLASGFLQHLVKTVPAAPFDLVLMLNTYRDWNAAQLHPKYVNLPQEFDDWLARAAKAAILTVVPEQIAAMRHRGWQIEVLGPGEDRSVMVFVRFTAVVAPSRYSPPPRHILQGGLGTANLPETHRALWQQSDFGFKNTFLHRLSRGVVERLVRTDSPPLRRILMAMLTDYRTYKEAFRMETQGNLASAEALGVRSPRRLAVMGFGRSGTTFVMEFLEHCGIYLDQPNWAKEHELLRFIDDTLFAQHFNVRPGRPYGTLPSSPLKISEETGKLAEFFIRYMDLRCLEAKRSTWAAKDPRMTILHNLWEPHLDTVLITFKRPDEVAASYVRRGWITGDDAMEVALGYWARFNLAALEVYRKMAQTRSVAVLNFDTGIVDKTAQVVGALGYSVDRARVAMSYDEKRSVDAPVKAPDSILRIYDELCRLEEITLKLAAHRSL